MIENNRHYITLQALAVVAVVLNNINPAWLKGGFIGVDIIFMLAGYSITKFLLEQEQTHLQALKIFFKKILPPLMALCLLACAAAYIFLDKADYKSTVKTALWVFLMNSNTYFYKESIPYSNMTIFNMLWHTWVLGVIAQFYIIYSIKIMGYKITKRMGIGSFLQNYQMLLLLGAGSLIYTEYSIYIRGKAGAELFYLIHARFWEFVIGGVALTLPWKKWVKAVEIPLFYASIATIILTVLWARIETFQGHYAIPLAIAVATLLYTGKNTAQERTWSQESQVPWLAGIAYSTYGLYLWHWVVIALVKNSIEEVTEITAQPYALMIFGILTMTLIHYHVAKKLNCIHLKP